MRSRTQVALVLTALLAAIAPARAQLQDHLQCFRVKDSLDLDGSVDIASPQLELEAGCRIAKAKLACLPATGSGVEVNVSSRLPVVGVEQVDARICYPIECPTPGPAERELTDQFGTRTLTKLAPSLLCTPAIPVANLPPPQTRPKGIANLPPTIT